MKEIADPEAGIYEMDAATYHRNCGIAYPLFSASIGQILLERSPQHAWYAHPALNPDWRPSASETAGMEGTVLHQMLLEGDVSDIEVVDAENWRTKAAQAARDAALEAGKVPVLAARWSELQAMVEAVRENLPSDVFIAGRAEQVLIWPQPTRYGPVWCKARVDWLPDDPDGWLDDLKTTAVSAMQSASPLQVERQITDGHKALQAALYPNGTVRLRGGRPQGVRFVYAEREAPYGISLNALSPAAMQIASERLEAALEIWAQCLQNGGWPGYPHRLHYADPPGYALKRHEEQQEHRRQIQAFHPRVLNSPMPYA